MSNPNPCTCGSTNLEAKWNSETTMGWVHCDDCGKSSSPVDLGLGREAIIERWNEENPVTRVGG